jgi:hypothetical protein
VIVALASPASMSAGRGESAARENPAFERFIDRYLAEMRGGGQAPAGPADLSAAYFGRKLDTARRLREDLRAIERSSLSFDQDVDLSLSRGPSGVGHPRRRAGQALAAGPAALPEPRAPHHHPRGSSPGRNSAARRAG